MTLEHVFDEMEISADPFALCALQGRCTLGLGSQSSATLHYILAGRGELLCRGRPAIALERGTLALVPATLAHSLRSFGGPGLPMPDCRPAESALALHLHRAGDSEDEQGLLAICSRMTIGLRGARGLVDLLHEPLVTRIEKADAVLHQPLERLLQELSSPSLGSRAMIRALLLQCVIHLLRGRLLAGDGALDWMQALSDERLWSALKVMLEAPGDPHSLDSLAAVAGMSRSTFAERFSAACGRGAMDLLRELRMQRAASLLLRSDLPVKRIAQMVGFQSRSAFSRMFTQTIGLPPQAFRDEPR
ncbi:MAG: AraC family transcriptional regulator [Rhodospirillales bacterium]